MSSKGCGTPSILFLNTLLLSPRSRPLTSTTAVARVNNNIPLRRLRFLVCSSVRRWYRCDFYCELRVTFVKRVQQKFRYRYTRDVGLVITYEYYPVGAATFSSYYELNWFWISGSWQKSTDRTYAAGPNLGHCRFTLFKKIIQYFVVEHCDV